MFSVYVPFWKRKYKRAIDLPHELSQKTPFWDEVENLYDVFRERIKESNYCMDLSIKNGTISVNHTIY